MTDRLILLGCWKPYYTEEQTLQSISDIVQQLDPEGPFVYAALPYPYLQNADQTHFSDQVLLGVDNMLGTQPGSYAEHFGAKMVQDAKAGFVLLGEREARQVLGDDDATISHKVSSALTAGLKVLACVRESKTGGAHALEAQLQAIFQGVSPEQVSSLILVYQSPSAIFFKNSHFVEDLVKSLETFKAALTTLGEEHGSQVQFLLELPNYLRACDDLIEATAPYCAGYYFPAATLNPSLITDIGQAWTRWRSHTAEPDANHQDQQQPD